MAEIKWIKISTNIFDDEAIKIIEQMPEGDALIVIWLKLLITAGRINDNGLIYVKEHIPYTDDMLAIVFNKPVTLIRLALTTFEKFGMINICDEQTILISNWEKHQNTDAMEKIREQNRIRKQKQREREKLLLTDVEGMSRKMSRDVTQQNKNKNIELDIDNSNTTNIVVEEQQQTKTKKFTKPTIEEIKTYCTERQNGIDAQYFYDYYESKGWQIGKNPMKDWKAAVRTWERKDFNKGGDNNANNATDTRRNPNESKYSRENGWF